MKPLSLKTLALALSVTLSSGFVSPAAGEESADDIVIDLDAQALADTISMSFDGALLKDVLLLFSQQSGLNFIASQDVESKKVTVYFENVTPKDALNAIVTANGLTYSKAPGSDIFIVSPAGQAQPEELVTKVLRLKHMRLSNSPLDVGGQVTVSDLQQSSAPSDSGTATSSSSSSASSGTATSTRGADRLVQRLLSPQGRLTMDLSTNSLIITDTKESIAAVEKVLEELDVPPSQVILEVQVMEVSKTVASNIGVEWGGADGAFLSLTGGQRTTQLPLKAFRQVEQLVNPVLDPADETPFIAAAGDSSTMSQSMFGIIDATSFQAVLHMIQADNQTKNLARPRVLTQNNEAATIKVVTNAAISTILRTSGEGGTATSSTEAERAEIGVTMRMTPQINADNSVSLFLEPAVTTLQDATVDVADNAARDTKTRLVRTMARVKDNETLVIGGLIDNQGSFAKRKIPFLGDLPIIGHAFRYDADEDVDRELLIFITPHIVRGPSSLGPQSATAKGEDLAVRRMLDQFMDKELDSMSGSFQGFEKTKRNFFTREEELVRDAERRYSNPVVEKQMTQALDALSPQVVDRQISQTLDALGAKK